MTDEPQPIAYTCVMGGPASLKAHMNALGAALGWTGDNFAMEASTDGEPPATWVYGYNDGVSVGWHDMVVERVFEVPEGFSEAQINGLLDAMKFSFRPIMPGQSGRDVRGGQVAEYLTEYSLLAISGTTP